MSAQPVKTLRETAAEYGLKSEEYDVILQRLNREPNEVELGVFSVMWSEHCSYKSSKKHLVKFPTTGPRVICGPGENAGVIDIGDGQACIFKMESHNHPSYIEPYQGAATGVGGIMRDVFTMGARPVALLNALRFGDPSHPKTRRLVSGVVSGVNSVVTKHNTLESGLNAVVTKVNAVNQTTAGLRSALLDQGHIT